MSAPFVLAVVERSKGQDVEKEKRSSDGDRDAQLCGVIAWVCDDQWSTACCGLGGLFTRGTSLVPPRTGCGTLGTVCGQKRWDPCGGGCVVEHVMQVVQVRYQMLPEGHFSSSIMIPNTRLQPNMQIKLIMRTVLGPCHFFKTVCLGVDELSVLRNWLVRIPKNKFRHTQKKKKS